MTGRALYDRMCDHLAANQIPSYLGIHTLPTSGDQTPSSWSYLSNTERRVWNATARALKVQR